ncbi:ergothioneine biosynthesis glutamate--cysteine ligase EgtA [Marmoricola sp. Leaf446]|uniref:ergothioneine biosynthesis glutamate--cysteine ligase EgtA n=1 Tax=Marmoricola sp. Leaf446 TaxID=1736379 RepID=UPI0009EAB8BD|nr:ergothioneine biosynthesis glutamate--cysteine ligase EgtA [Marmoricola sp. Leaf446]
MTSQETRPEGLTTPTTTDRDGEAPSVLARRRLPDVSSDPLLRAADPVAAAEEHVAATALRETPPGPEGGGRVGLELEMHLVDLERPGRRPIWDEVRRLVHDLPALPMGSSVTVEPGGQVELSTPPADDVVLSIAALGIDRDHLRRGLAAAGFGAAPLGTDPARPVRRVNPAPRYSAMERHFDALGCAGAGKAMMSATAALQVNLDAGPEAEWSCRMAHLRALVPVLVAASSTSPYLAGEASGWHSMRQGVWQGIDHGRSDPFPAGPPAAAWAAYALDAPVMLILDDGVLRPVTERVRFRDWLSGDAPFSRPAVQADLDYHLTTLFPPVRPRGYLELRCLDALPDRWWPAMTALTVTLVDDPVAADLAAEIVAPVHDRWETAAREGLADPAVRRAVLGCVELAVSRGPVELRSELLALHEVFARGSSPAEELRSRVEAVGPLAVLLEEARA